MSQRKILLIDNQSVQFTEIASKLQGFEVYPRAGDDEDYDVILDAVRVFLSGRYPSPIQNAANDILRGYVNKHKFDLYIIDYKLTGNDDGSHGIYLATKLRSFQSIGPTTVPVLFLSGHGRGEADLKSFEQMEPPKEWIEKGYASNRILDNAYFTLHVQSAINRLIGDSEDMKYKKKLSELIQNGIYAKALPALKAIEKGIEDNNSLSQADILFMKELINGKKSDPQMKKMSEEFIKLYKKNQ